MKKGSHFSIVNCLTCGKELKTYPCLIKKGLGKFCSKKCAGKFYGKFHSGENNSNYRGGSGEKVCEFCNKKFLIVYSLLKDKKNGRFCSKKCKALSQVRKVKGVCLSCGKGILSRRWQVELGQGKFCNNKCYHKWIKETGARSGSNNSAWNGGSSRLPYPWDFNEELKELIRKRDSYKCQDCGCPQVECNRKLAVHHIDYDKDNLSPKNLISLCRRCHARTSGSDNKKRLRYQMYFNKALHSRKLI